MYGNQLQEKGLRLQNAVLNTLIPPAEIEYAKSKAEFDTKKKLEAEERTKRELEAKEKKDEEDRLKAIELANRVPEPVIDVPIVEAEPRILIQLDGAEIDITGTKSLIIIDFKRIRNGS